MRHALWLRNELDRFELSSRTKSRREKLACEGFLFRPYTPADRDELLEFLDGKFPPCWKTWVQRGIDSRQPFELLLSTHNGHVTGFTNG